MEPDGLLIAGVRERGLSQRWTESSDLGLRLVYGHLRDSFLSDLSLSDSFLLAFTSLARRSSRKFQPVFLLLNNMIHYQYLSVCVLNSNSP